MSGSLCKACAQPVSANETLCPTCAAAERANAAEPAGERESAVPTSDRELVKDSGFRLTWLLSGACVLIFLGAQAIGNVDSWEPYEKIGYYSPDRIWEGAYWGLITSALVHLDFLHLAMNLYWLWTFGHAFERAYGPARWLIFFVTAAWVSSGIQMLTGDPGLGASGVGYALFGFGWVARNYRDEFREVVDDGVVRLFVGWFFLCVAGTLFGVMQIGNGAHLGGLLFGVLTAQLAQAPQRRLWSSLGLAALTALSVLPLAWCPWSMNWTAIQAGRAHQAQRYMEAAGWYHQSLKLGQDPTWAWHSLAGIYGYLQLDAEYADALRNLRQLSPAKADEVEQNYGPPLPVK